MFSAFLVYYLINNYSFLSRQLLQIFVHPKSSHRYLELFCSLFKLPFSYPSHPLLLFPLLFCLLFSSLFPIYFTRYYCFLCYSVFFLSCLSPPPHNHRYCSLCYSVSFLSTLSAPPPNHRYCFLCYSVSFYPVPFSLFCRTFSSLLFLVISRLRKHIFVKC